MSTISPTERLSAPTTVGPAARLRARLAPSALDRRLASGESPWGDAALSARSTRLLRHGTRRRIAARLTECVAAVRSEPGIHHPLRITAPVSGDGVRVAADELLKLAGRLRAAAPATPQGVAIARLLVADGTGPLYADGDALILAARRAMLALGDPTPAAA